MERGGDARLAAGPEATWYLERAFTPGAQLGTVYDDPETPVVVTGIEQVTTIRVPSGRLVVDAPWHDDEVWKYEQGWPTAPERAGRADPAGHLPGGVLVDDGAVRVHGRAFRRRRVRRDQAVCQ
ncbi:hypothetical protein JHN47_01025 [Streptomyces sp. MBT62]|nr:hypothetical protein [Streptomyces sp. MBT62]